MPTSAMACTATGLTWSAGIDPADRTSTFPSERAVRKPAAIWERPALCTQTNNTLGLPDMGASIGSTSATSLDSSSISPIIELMIVEVISVDEQLMRRARVHAALGEPARLAIVDRLVPGDASPGELGVELGLATNLLAHHLRVLQEAGLIRRVQSEGDRRRTYVRLTLQDPLVRAAVLPHYPPAAVAPRVVFVCTHNSARSQLAAASWRRVSSVPAACAG